MILTSNRGFAEWGELFRDQVVATVLLNHLLHHATAIQIKGASNHWRTDFNLVPDRTGAISATAPQLPPKRRELEPLLQ